MLSAIAVKAAVSACGLVGASFDPHHKGAIAGMALGLSLAGDAMLAQLHLKKRG